MKSKFNSRCKFCGLPIRIGDEIEKRESGQWGHSLCPNGKPKETPAYVPPVDFVPSKYQEEIFREVETGQGHLIVVAAPGSGKSTTALQSTRFIPSRLKVLYCAFNKRIVDDFKPKLSAFAPHAEIGTTHSIAYRIIRQSYPRCKVDADKLDGILDDFWPIPDEKDEVQEVRVKRAMAKKLIGYVKNTLTNADSHSAVRDLISRYNIETNGQEEEIIGALPDILRQCRKQLSTVDFDDMLWLVNVLNLVPTERYDVVIGDEIQDFNACQLDLILRLVKPETGRFIGIGDPRQSIYGFRGADTSAIPNLIETLQAKTLPLSVCYRSDKAIIDLTNTVFPDDPILPRENAGEGLVGYIDIEKFEELVKVNDLVLCRVNAPLVPHALGLIQKGIKAVVLGRDIGAAIASLARKTMGESIDECYTKLSAYADKEHKRLDRRNAREMEHDSLDDRVNTLRAVLDSCETPQAIIPAIESLFSDNAEGVTFASIHKAKGGEADRVFILRPELLPHPRAIRPDDLEQEKNVMFVCYSRAKHEVYFVSGEA